MTKQQATQRLEEAGLTWESAATDIIDELIELAAELGKDDPHHVAETMALANLK
jgi:hypothetical protein